MSNLSNFWNSDRAAGVARIVADKPTTLSVIRDNAADPATMTVRLEVLATRPENMDGSVATATVVRVLVFGAFGLDLKRGDRFWHEGLWFEIVQILPGYVDRTTAVGEARLAT